MDINTGIKVTTGANMTLQHPATHLTSNYRRDTQSNNYKLLDLGHHEHKQIHDNLRLIELWRDVDEACGFTLDKIGKNVLELREGRDDEAFRKAIKIKIRSNLSAGTVEDFNIIAAILFGDNFESITETWQLEQYNFEPAGLLITLYDITREHIFDFESTHHMLTSIKAGGVRLVWYVTFPKRETKSTVFIGHVGRRIRRFRIDVCKPETDVSPATVHIGMIGRHARRFNIAGTLPASEVQPNLVKIGIVGRRTRLTRIAAMRPSAKPTAKSTNINPT